MQGQLQSKSLNNIQFALAVIFLLHEMPIVGLYMPAIIYAGIVVLLFLSLISKLTFNDILKLTPIYLIPILDILLDSVHLYDLRSLFMNISGFLQITIYAMLAYIVIKRNDLMRARYLFLVYLAVAFVTSCTTYIGCQIYPDASRVLAVSNVTGEEYYNIYMAMNIGGFHFIYTLVILTPLLISLIKNNTSFYKKRGLKWFLVIMLIVAGAAIIASQYTTAILLYLVSLVLLLFNRQMNYRRTMRFIYLSLIIVLISCSFLPDILVGISERIESEIVSSRLHDLGIALSGDIQSFDSESDVASRKEIFQVSIESFVDNPLGSWGGKTTKIGGHSYLFDNMAKYGLLAVFLIIFMVMRIYRIYISNNKSKFYYGTEVVMLVYFCILFILNPHVFYVPITFAMPLFVYIQNQQ